MPLMWIAAVGFGIATVLNFARYAKSKNSTQLFMACCYLAACVGFAFLAWQ